MTLKSQKYYDHHNDQTIDLDRDGCNLSNWHESYGKARFARHPKGFLIFLSPDELEACDEYSASDPYTVETNLDSEFHKRRIECTLELIKDAMQATQGIPRILDLGCGQGHITARIQETYPNAEISALDYSVSAIQYAVDHFPQIAFDVANVYELPYASSYFDIVVCNNLWEHVPDPLSLLQGISKIIKPLGFLIISTPSRYRLENLIRVMRGKSVTFVSNHHVTEYSVGQVLEQCRWGGGHGHSSPK
jgi:2-polyprenyl-3-methyl-5-hydroxy-6-metoxy-1,4-benzoquinol methylase